MKFAAVIAILSVTGCASQAPRDTGWRDVSGQARGQAGLDRDVAQCDFELEKARAGAPSRPYTTTGPYASQMSALGSAMLSGPGPRFYEACMSAKGWKQVY